MSKTAGSALILAGSICAVASVGGLNQDFSYSPDFTQYRELDGRVKHPNLRAVLSHPDSIQAYQEMVARRDSLYEENDGFPEDNQTEQLENLVRPSSLFGLLLGVIAGIGGTRLYREPSPIPSKK